MTARPTEQYYCYQSKFPKMEKVVFMLIYLVTAHYQFFGLLTHINSSQKSALLIDEGHCWCCSLHIVHFNGRG